MATVSWNGAKFYAAPLQELPNGDWLMKMQQHGPRFAVGTIVRVPAKDIIELASAEMPPIDESTAALQAAMDARPAGMPTPAQILANWRAGKLNEQQAFPNNVTPPPPVIVATSATLVPPPPTQDPAMSSKLSALPGLAQDLSKSIDALADTTATRLQKAKDGAVGAVDKLNTIAADVETSTSAIEDVVNQMTNGAPAGK